MHFFYSNDGRLPGGVTNLLGLKQRTKLLVDVQGTGTLSRWNTLKADKRGAAALKAAIRLKMKSPLAFLACVWVTQSNLSCSSHRKVKLSLSRLCPGSWRGEDPKCKTHRGRCNSEYSALLLERHRVKLTNLVGWLVGWLAGKQTQDVRVSRR